MDTETIKKIIKERYNSDIKSIYSYDGDYYVLLDDYFSSMMLIVDPELNTDVGFVLIDSDIGNKILSLGEIID